MRKIVRSLFALGLATALLSAGCVSALAADLVLSVTGGSEDSMQLNSATSGYLNGLSALRHLYEGLYKLDQTGEPVLGQAASVDISEDMMTWTFTLRDDITWSDGQTVTANDFIFGWENLAVQGGDYASLLSDVATSYEAPDERTITLHLAFPCAYLPAVLAFPSTYPARQDYVEQYGDAYGTDPDKSVYNGPFLMTD